MNIFEDLKNNQAGKDLAFLKLVEKLEKLGVLEDEDLKEILKTWE